MSDMDAMADPVSPYRCERCGVQDRRVRLCENGDPRRLGEDWRLMPLHPECFARWQGEVDLGLASHGGNVESDFGWWTLPDGRRARLSWRARDGQLYLHHPGAPDRPRGWDQRLTVLARAEVTNLLEGWADACGDLGWLADRLALAGVCWTPPRLRAVES